MGYIIGEKVTVNIIDKKTGETVATQEVQTSDIHWDRKNNDFTVKMEIDLESK